MYCSYANEIYDHFDDTLKLHDKLKARFTKTKQPQQLEVLKAQSQELVVMREFNQAIKSSVKFKMDQCHNLLPEDKPPLDILKEFVPAVNLPYESICIELDAETLGVNQDTPIVIIAQQKENEICVYSFFKLDNEWTSLHSGSAENTVYAVINRDSFDGYIIGLDGKDHKTCDQISNWINRVSIRSVCNLLCALSCSNTRIDNSPITPSKTKNILRQSKNKLPLFEFKILTVDSGKETSQRNSSSTSSGTHASPRIHLRRGHIRKLPNKNVWVNACVVGDKNNGVIQKDYLVK